jgi:osmotically-inducible protein OsmY
MYRNIVFRLSFIFTLAVLFTGGCVTSKNLSTTSKNDNLQITGLQVGSVNQQSSDRDASITSAIKLKFAHDEVVSASNIHVDTSHQSVSLTGSVNSQSIADRALNLGRSVDGVKTVHSFLVVR